MPGTQVSILHFKVLVLTAASYGKYHYRWRDFESEMLNNLTMLHHKLKYLSSYNISDVSGWQPEVKEN